MNPIATAVLSAAAALSILTAAAPARVPDAPATGTARIVDVDTGDTLATVEVPAGCTAIYRGTWDGVENGGAVEDGTVNVWDGARARIDVVDGNSVRATTGVVYGG